MAQFKDLIVNGAVRVLSKVYSPEFVGKLTGNADTATKLSSAKTVQTNLGSTTAASFDGSANITPGVTGTLPIANGGTGATTAANALTNLGVTATAAELNYVDGVTSNIQTQLNGKAASSHTHDYLPLSGGTLTGNLKMEKKSVQFGTSSGAGISAFNGSDSKLILTVGYSNFGLIALTLEATSTSTAQVYPGMNNACSLGTSSYKWKEIYASTSTISTSDKTKKTNIIELDIDHTTDFIMGLKPSSFKFVDGTSDRTHYGMIAQDVEELMETLEMDSKDFAGFVKANKTIEVENTVIDEDGNEKVETTTQKVEGEYDYFLRYEEFIAPAIRMIQIQQNKIESLESKVSELEEKLNTLISTLNA